MVGTAILPCQWHTWWSLIGLNEAPMLQNFLQDPDRFVELDFKGQTWQAYSRILLGIPGVTKSRQKRVVTEPGRSLFWPSRDGRQAWSQSPELQLHLSLLHLHLVPLTCLSRLWNWNSSKEFTASWKAITGLQCLSHPYVLVNTLCVHAHRHNTTSNHFVGSWSESPSMESETTARWILPIPLTHNPTHYLLIPCVTEWHDFCFEK